MLGYVPMEGGTKVGLGDPGSYPKSTMAPPLVSLPSLVSYIFFLNKVSLISQCWNSFSSLNHKMRKLGPGKVVSGPGESVPELALQHGVLQPTGHLRCPNPELPLAESCWRAHTVPYSQFAFSAF